MNRILNDLCALPTAPYREHAVMGYIHEFCEQHDIALKEDKHGNLLAVAREGRERWVMVAHMDHPGMEAQDFVRDGILRAAFRGYVLATHLKLKKVKVLFFVDGEQISGQIIDAIAGERGEATEVHVRVKEYVPAGAMGMFDLAVAETRGNLFHSRAIDDLAGVAAALETLLNVKRRRKRSKGAADGAPGVAALLTRAEEDGFIGAIAAAREKKLLRKSDLVISIECSAMQPYAPQGAGAVIRVGDRTSVFDPAMTYHLGTVAESLKKKDKRFSYQRALMPGGTCEATAFGVYGMRAGAVCVPLGNYHNMVPGKKQIAAEYIDMNDWQSLVKLLTAAVTSSPGDSYGALAKRLDKRFDKNAKLLR